MERLYEYNETTNNKEHILCINNNRCALPLQEAASFDHKRFTGEDTNAKTRIPTSYADAIVPPPGQGLAEGN